MRWIYATTKNKVEGVTKEEKNKLLLIACLHSLDHLPFGYTGNPLVSTLIKTMLLPTEPEPTSHTTSDSDALVTSQATPPIVTLFSDTSLLKPLPDIVILVPPYADPEKENIQKGFDFKRYKCILEGYLV